MSADHPPVPVLDGRSSSGTWGALAGAVALGTILAFLLYAYFYLAVSNEPFVPGYRADPPLLWPGVLLGGLVASLVAALVLWKAAVRADASSVATGAAALALAGLLFLVAGAWVVGSEDLRPTLDSYSAIVVTVQVFHAVATATAVVMAGLVAFEAVRLLAHRWVVTAAVATAVWWCYVVLGWLAVGFAVYLYPQLR